MSQKWAMVLAVLASLAITAAPARASILLVGANNQAPDAFATNPVTDGTTNVLATQTLSGSSSTLDVTITEWVLQVKTTKELDFVYQVTNNAASTDAVGRVTVSNFGTGAPGTTGPWLIDAGYVVGTGTNSPPSQPAPDTQDRLNGNHGNVVGWNFTDLGVTPTNLSSVLVIETSAMSYNAFGAVAVIDGSTVDFPAYQPVMVPEPLSVTLAGMGALGMIGYGLRRRKAMGA